MKNKLSALEQLRQDKTNSEILCREHEVRITKSLSYVGDNWSSLLLKSIFSGGLFTSRKGQGGTSPFSNIARISSDVFPMVWSIAQPYLIGILTSKIKSYFFGSKKKKRKEK